MSNDRTADDRTLHGADDRPDDRTDDDQTFHDDIEGYCSSMSVVAGASIGLHVSTRGERYDVTVERWGATRDTVASVSSLPGTFRPPPDDADVQGCGWPVSLEIATGEDWRPGFHLVTLRAHDAPDGRDVAHACFVVRAAGRRASAVLVLDTNTWNAYNTWGGCSLYTGGHRVSFGRPFARGILCRPEVDRDDRKARPTRWGEDPDVDGLTFQAYRTRNAYPAAIGSAGWFSHGRRFVEWAESAGYEFDMLTSRDVADDPSALDGYRLVIGVGHDEYWSAPQRDAVEAHVARGGHLVSLSGNTMFWQVRDEVDPAGTASMTCHKYRAHLDDPVTGERPAAMSGMWADPVVGRPEWSFLGAGSAFGLYHRFGRATARGVGGFVVYRDDHWIFDGTGLRYGDVLGAAHGAVGYETVGCPITFDETQLPVPWPRDDLPTDHEIVAMVPSSNLGVGEYPASISALDDQGDLEFVADRIFGGDRARARHGNAVMSVCRPFDGGGEVVVVGTTDWVFGLGRDDALDRVTANLLDRYGVDRPNADDAGRSM